MSNLFPKYKKSHRLQTALPVKNRQFLFSLPINLSHSPTPEATGATAWKPPHQEPSPMLCAPVQKEPSKLQGILRQPSKVINGSLVEQATCSRPLNKLISHCSSISISGERGQFTELERG